jgi:cell division protein FtsB
MKRFNMMRLLLGCLLIGTLGGVGAVTAAFVIAYQKSYREHQHIQMRETAYEAQLGGIREEIGVKERYLELLLEDPEFLERVVRKQLGYVRRGEVVFRFDDPLIDRQ